MPRWLLRARLLTVADFEEAPQTIARWLSERAGRPICFKKVKPSDEQVLPPPDQRELDALLSGLDCKHGA